MKIITEIEKLRVTSDEFSIEDIIRFEARTTASMKKLLLRNNGLGLAAIQVGIRRQMFLLKTNRGEIISVYNPKIIDRYDKIIITGEGCLSLPGKSFKTSRYKYIEAEWYDGNGEKRKTLFHDDEAVIFQHECDHLMGVLLIDRGLKPTVRTTPKVGRNAQCPCGSGKKYKKCCLNKNEAEAFSV